MTTNRDPLGPFWPLHRLNELRVGYLREQVCRHLQRNPRLEHPLSHSRVLDAGCSGGILSEAMARLGAQVIGIDVVEHDIHIATLHTQHADLKIEYRHTTAEALAAAGEQQDVVLNMGGVEHVADLDGFMTASGTLVGDHGLMSIATINRTPLAWLVAIFGAEYMLRWMPRETHRYQKLRRPVEVEKCLARVGLDVIARTGVRVDPFTRSLHLTRLMGFNYVLIAARRPAERRLEALNQAGGEWFQDQLRQPNEKLIQSSLPGRESPKHIVSVQLDIGLTSHTRLSSPKAFAKR